MSIGISDEHVELAASLRKWAAGLGGAETARTADGDAGARFDEAWKAIGEMGVATIGDDGGTALDQAVDGLALVVPHRHAQRRRRRRRARAPGAA